MTCPQLLQVFESSAEYLGPDLFTEFALPYIRRISAAVREKLKQKGIDVPMVSQEKDSGTSQTERDAALLCFRLFVDDLG